MDLEQCAEKISELERSIAVLQTEYEAHSQYTKIAMDKAETVMNIRLNSMNEFRAQLSDQASTFLTRDNYEVNHKLLETKIESLQKIVWTGIGMLLIVQIAVQIAMHFIP